MNVMFVVRKSLITGRRETAIWKGVDTQLTGVWRGAPMNLLRKVWTPEDA